VSSTVTIDRDKLDAVMAKQCLDASELAARSGVHRITVYNVMKGVAGSRRTIRALALAMGVDVSEITTVASS
jgi:electron transfer flavoprotein alpha/beta subunit